MPHHQKGNHPKERVEYELSDVATSSSASYLQGGAPLSTPDASLSAPNRILIYSNERKERKIQPPRVPQSSADNLLAFEWKLEAGPSMESLII